MLELLRIENEKFNKLPCPYKTTKGTQCRVHGVSRLLRK